MNKIVIKTEYSQKGLYSFINPYSYLLLRNKWKLAIQIKGYFVDGISLCWIISLLKRVHIERKSFDMTSIAKQLFSQKSDELRSFYFIGSRQEEIRSFIKLVNKSFNHLTIIGWRNGYFNSHNEISACVEDVLAKNPDVLIVGLGTPFQEYFLLEVSRSGWNGLGFSCGGFIHQTAKRLNYYPPLFNKLNMRWVFRMIDEPKLIKRYLVYYPKGIFYFVYDLLTGRIRIDDTPKN